ncbi:MAG: thiamine phosphate synthase [Rhodospirillales bacterium]|nr:thiamine phosphate synthase [Rhodospirillales bacterium]
MNTLTTLASRLHWCRIAPKTNLLSPLPRFFLFSDDERLPDPAPLLRRLPKKAAVVLRHRDAEQLELLVKRTTPLAHRLNLKVLVANDVRLALHYRCDGVHLSQAQARQGPPCLNPKALPPGLIITAAAHDAMSLKRAHHAGAHLVMLSPVFATASHPGAKSLGIRRFATLARLSDVPVVALGGITSANLRRLRLTSSWGFAAIDGWHD